MARPTKAQIKKRNEIKEIGAFIRYNEIYTELANYEKTKNDNELMYHFCVRCKDRFEIPLEDLDDNEYYKYLFKYYLSLSSFEKEVLPYSYAVETIINTSDLFKIFTREEIENSHFLPMILISKLWKGDDIENIELTLEHILPRLSSEQKERLKKYYLHHSDTMFRERHKDLSGEKYSEKYKTFVKRTYIDEVNHCYVALNFKKDKKELIEYISKIKDDYDKDNTIIRNMSELFKEPENHMEIGIIPKDKRKPYSGKLSDILFIYDCKRINKILCENILTNKYIIDEINDYWNKNENWNKLGTKQESPAPTEIYEKMQEETMKEYYEIAKKYIDEQKYDSYLNAHTYK